MRLIENCHRASLRSIHPPEKSKETDACTPCDVPSLLILGCNNVADAAAKAQAALQHANDPHVVESVWTETNAKILVVE